METDAQARGTEDPGAPLELASARDAHTLVRARGSVFLVTARDGNVAPAGAIELGLFDHDTRHLSHWELRVHGGTSIYLSSEGCDDATNRFDLMLSGPTVGNLDDPGNYLHVCRRQLVDAHGLAEIVELHSFALETLQLEVVIAFAADFADVFEVRGARRPRRGRRGAPRVGTDSVVLSYRGLDGVDYATEVRFDRAPESLDAREARFCFRLAPHESSTLRAEVRTWRGAPPPPQRRSFDERARAIEVEAEAFRASCTRIRCDDPVLQQALEQSSTDLFSLWIRDAEHPILAAGVPWFCCPFGRDALIASYEALTLQPDIAAQSLRTLASSQGTRFDDFTEEEPGRILHELRLGEMVRTGEMPHRPYYGSIDSTPLFVIVLHAHWEITGDASLARELAPALRAALGWIDARSVGGTQLVTYARRSPRGLDNQGWKDSRTGVCTPDGVSATPPIALCEVQGYCVDAYARGAELLEALGDLEGAAKRRADAARMRELCERELWIADRARYAFAVDGTGARFDTVVSNLGHLLWSRVPGPERAASTADLLLAPDSLTRLGLRTLAAHQRAFNPLSYHNGSIWPHDNALVAMGLASYGLGAGVVQLADAMRESLLRLGRDDRLPELFTGIDPDVRALVRYPVACSPQAWSAAAPFLVLQAVLGLRFDAARHVVRIHDPKLPSTVRELEIEGMRIGDARVALRFRRVGRRCHVDRLDVEGGRIRAVVELAS